LRIDLNRQSAQDTGLGSDTLISIECLHGGLKNDVLIGNSANNLLNGDTGNDTLTGGGGQDTLYGGIGNDQLTGGSSADYFRWSAYNAGTDLVTDFNATEGDKLVFVSANFGALPAGAISQTLFVANSQGVATNTSQRWLFNTQTGALKYDRDGSGSSASTTLATLNVRSLRASDILIAAS
jgi:Ca2+-binding RTX toxin-like protein